MAAAVEKQGQITDRFSRAVDQLGQQEPGRIDVRVGAIFSLQRIMRDSPQGLDQPAVAELLATFVRTHSAHAEGKPPPVDVQTAVTVLANRDPTRDGPTFITDLSGADLHYSSARGAQLAGASLDDSILNWADLTGATLTKARLVNTDLRWAALTDARMAGADLQCADLSGADLRGANLSGITSGPLGDIEHHPGMSVAMTIPEGSSCRAPRLSVLLKHAALTGADLTGAKLSGAQLDFAGLQCAKLGGANLSLAEGLTQEQLDGAYVDEHTLLPPGLLPPSGPSECPIR